MDNGIEKIGTGRRAAIYARASEPSERERTPVEEQIDVCRAVAAELGYAVADGAIYSDTGPGRAMARPGLTALIGALAQGRVTAVFVHTLDRLGRPESKPLTALLKELQRREIPLYIGKIPRGYSYDPATGNLLNDPDEVAAANLVEWRPPEYIIIPREDDRD